MDVSSSEIYELFKESGLITGFSGTDHRVKDIVPVENSGPGDLVFVEKEKFLESAIQRNVAAILTTEELAEKLKEYNKAVLIAPNVRLALAYLRQKFADRDLYQTEWPRIHPSAVIHESARVSDDAVVGPGAVIGARVELGSGAVIMANAVIEHDVNIGAGTVVHPNCVIGYRCEIANDVILKSGCVIGSEGLGFAQDQQRRHHRIPHTGIVVIEEKVVVGANCTIDRATYTETRVRSGCIIDALCHLAHNVELGEDCTLIAQTGIAGSSRFGKRVIASGQTGVLDHVTVPDDTVLLHRAGVINSINKTGVYATTPPQPFQKYLKNIAVFQRLGEVWTRLKALEKKVAALSK